MKKLSRRGGLAVLVLFAAFAFVAALRATTELQRLPSPDGRFTAVTEYYTWRSLLPMTPGSSSDRPGFVTIYSSDGHSLGRAPVPMLQLAHDLRWEADAAEIRLVAHWDLSRGRVMILSQ
jgi:hypothetical protein